MTQEVKDKMREILEQICDNLADRLDQTEGVEKEALDRVRMELKFLKANI